MMYNLLSFENKLFYFYLLVIPIVDKKKKASWRVEQLQPYDRKEDLKWTIPK